MYSGDMVLCRNTVCDLVLSCFITLIYTTDIFERGAALSFPFIICKIKLFALHYVSMFRARHIVIYLLDRIVVIKYFITNFFAIKHIL